MVTPRSTLLLLGLVCPVTGQDVTFHRDVAPIVFQHCASCHRPGEIGPFPLLTFKQVSRRARMIQRVIEERIMPPWNPEPGHGSFVGERRLTKAQIESFAAWVRGGKIEGDPKDSPALPTFTKGWQLGKPDLIVAMPKAYAVPADGPDIYRNFVVPIELDEDKWVTAFELRPGARTVLHHALVNLDNTGRARQQDGRNGTVGFRGMSSGSGSLGIWAVGAMPHKLPMGLAMPLPKGSDIVLSSHFHPSGKAESERTTLGLYFAKKPPTRSLVPLQLPPMWGFAYRLDIPAGQSDYKVRDFAILPADCEAVEISSHAHTVCRSMRAWAVLPSGASIKLFKIARWNFNWQGGYTYRAPVALPAGTRVHAEFTYDNSKNNPSNPYDPPRRIRAGRETSDEMARITLTLVPKNEADAAPMRKKFNRLARTRTLRYRKMAGLDHDHDGFLSADELPEERKHLMRRLDRDRDGRISFAELETRRR